MNVCFEGCLLWLYCSIFKCMTDRCSFQPSNGENWSLPQFIFWVRAGARGPGRKARAPIGQDWSRDLDTGLGLDECIGQQLRKLSSLISEIPVRVQDDHLHDESPVLFLLRWWDYFSYSWILFQEVFVSRVNAIWMTAPIIPHTRDGL